MNHFLTHFPESLQAYIQQFETDPAGAIERLEKFTAKRGPDAVSRCLLAWMYHKQGNDKKAISSAWQAKVYAPGSPFLEQFHYYLKHPKKFNAWHPEHNKEMSRVTYRYDDQAHPIMDLDSLISKLSSIETRRLKPEDLTDDDTDLGSPATQTDDIVTETLAVIHEKQKNYQAAILTYEKLAALYPDKEKHYQKQINRLKKKSKK